MCNQNPRCPVGTILLQHSLAVKPIPARCGNWACRECGPRKARRLRKRLMLTHPQRFLTLTLKASAAQSPGETLDLANKAWSILFRRLRRKFPTHDLGYAKVVEVTKAGTPHLHILLTCPYVAQAWVSNQWRQLTGSYVVDIRKVKSPRMLNGYLTSYLTKAVSVPPGRRKWSGSKAYVPPEPPRELADGEIPPTGRYMPASLAEVTTSYLLAGWRELHGWLQPGIGVLSG